MSSNQSGVPLVWYTSGNYLQTVTITPASALVAYISTDEIKENGVIHPGSTISIALSQIMTVDQNTELSVSGGFVSDALEIVSEASSTYTCGITRAEGTGQAVPYCAFALYPSFTVPITPLQKIFVMFASSTYDLGANMVKALDVGLYVDLTGVAERDVSFDITAGWQTTPTGEIWATRIDAGTNLASFMIEPPGSNQPRFALAP